MDLFDLEQNEPITKNKKEAKTLKIIIAAIIIILVIIFAIVGIMMYLQTLETKFYVDGSSQVIGETYFQTTEDGKIYISIQEMAKILNIPYYNGEYGKNSEDLLKGYVTFEGEIVTFESNSNKIYKISKEDNSTSEEYSYMYIDEPLKVISGKVYTTPDGINKILNVSVNYTGNTISIYTIDYLNTYYTEKIADFGYKAISDKFENQKAMKNDILIVEKEDDDKMGIINPDGTELVGAKYDEIEYIENTGDYMVTISNKVGIINSQGKSKIDLLYDEIKILDEDLGLYIVNQNDKYGVVNSNGNIIIHIENDEIGIDTSLYRDVDIKNPYILFDNCIPVLRGEKWGLYNKGGANILPVEYDSIGCVVGTSTTNSSGNVVIIEEYEAIVIGKDDLYGVINSTGKELIPVALTTIYSITSEGQTKFRIEGTQNGSEYSYDLEEYFDAVGIKKVTKSNLVNNTDDIQDIVNTTTENTSVNENVETQQNYQYNNEENDDNTLVVEE